MTFEDFLREKHTKEYVGSQEAREDNFDYEIDHMDGWELIELAEEWHRQEVGETLQLLLKGQTNERIVL